MGLEKLKADCDIENIIQENQMLKAALRALMTESQINMCKKQLEYTTVPHWCEALYDVEATPNEQLNFDKRATVDRVLAYGLSNRNVATF